MKRDAPRAALVVDDDPRVLALLAAILQKAGFLVSQAADGREAYRKFQECPADVVVIDLLMPDEAGTETIARFNREYPKTRIVAISGAVAGMYLPLAQRLGAHAILRKPFGGPELLAAVNRVLLKI